MTQEVDEHVRLIMNNLTPSLAKDLRVKNARKSKFQVFWGICSKVLEELTAVNDCRHRPGFEETGEGIVNMQYQLRLYTKNGK